MSLIDSHAELRNRATTYKISEDTFESLQREGIESLANLAFALGSNPGVIQEDDFQKFITTLSVRDRQEILALRRLTFEAQTMLISSLKQEVSRPSASSSETKHMSPLERQSRIDALRARQLASPSKVSMNPVMA